MKLKLKVLCTIELETKKSTVDRNPVIDIFESLYFL